MIIRSISTVLAVAAVASASAAWADSAPSVNLSTVSGDVMVNQGQGFKPATPGMSLRAGDRVIVTAHGRAGLVYAGGCNVSLGAGSMATISAATPCKAGAHTAGVIAGAPADAPPPLEGAAATTPFGLSPGLLSLLVVGGFTLGAAGVSGAFEQQSSSP
jgi:hypothetical protein